ncbi:hypothetical protein BDM02DRAFT_952792 [Thelephora ganbajun]|uniref:Uncharacterized protein n=1 Tax=Thelephora ganbajun TaxID=370292 RepID=A0ACB6ZPJ9_THEGA|nr:hypothetical protein BDM02DRAFT_952792 [Thelephora ganbajun]
MTYTGSAFSTSSHTYSKSDWGIWTAAVVTDKKVPIDRVVAHASSGLNDTPLSNWYETVSGTVSSCRRTFGSSGCTECFMRLEKDGINSRK